MRSQVLTLAFLLAFTLASPLPPTSLQTVSPATREEIAKRQTPLNTFLDLLLDNLPAINGPIEAVTGILTTFEYLLAFLTLQKTTYNDLRGTCKPYTVLFARGTTEPGNVGILVGPPFIEALKAKIGKKLLAIQGVNSYDADVDGYLDGGDAGGIASMANQIVAAQTKCPDTKLIVSGYSQGGQLVHKSIAMLPLATAAWISKIVIFGDPLSSKPVTNIDPAKVKVFCNAGDDICRNGALILPAHLIYGLNGVAAAAFATS